MHVQASSPGEENLKRLAQQGQLQPVPARTASPLVCHADRAGQPLLAAAAPGSVFVHSGISSLSQK